jgi:photosystem II Psb28-2 protein
MTVLPSIQFFEGIPEALTNVSLRRDRRSGTRIVCMTFEELRSIAQFKSFRNRFSQGMKLTDEEGVITVEPSSVKFYFSGPEGDDFDRLECKFEIHQDDHWQRFIRFMNRYAATNGMEYGEHQSQNGATDQT